MPIYIQFAGPLIKAGNMEKLSYCDLNVIDQDRDLSAGSVRLFRHLVRIECGRLTWFKMSHAYMAQVANVSVSTIKRYISELVAAGYLVKRLNAATIGGIKHRIASSYRFIRPAATKEARKMVTLMQSALIARKAVYQTALWLMGKRSEVDKNITTPDSGEDELHRPMQSAYEAMLLDRERRRKAGI
jgi:hypothetical protein